MPAGLSFVLGLLAVAAVHRVLRAVRDRIYVCRGTAHGVARGDAKSATDQNHCHNLPNHDRSSVVGTKRPWPIRRPFVYGRLLTSVSVDRVLGAVRDRIHVLGGAANGIASRRYERGSDQKYGGCFLEHVLSSSNGSLQRG
jgi:hypothetical protein